LGTAAFAFLYILATDPVLM